MLAYKPVRNIATTKLLGFFHCLQGLKQGCIASPILFSLLVNELANEIFVKARHGIPLLASTITGLQNQLKVVSVAVEILYLTVKSKMMLFKKKGGGGGFWAAKETCF